MPIGLSTSASPSFYRFLSNQTITLKCSPLYLKEHFQDKQSKFAIKYFCIIPSFKDELVSNPLNKKHFPNLTFDIA